MKRLKLFKYTFFAISLIVSHNTFAQNLELNDIFKIYSLDSNSLKQFCIEKNFYIKKITENKVLGLIYTFESSENKSISFTKNFPKDTCENVALYYFFKKDKEYRILKKLLLNKGFSFKESADMIKNNQNYHDYWERFTDDKSECILSSKNFGNSHHFLIFNRK